MRPCSSEVEVVVLAPVPDPLPRKPPPREAIVPSALYAAEYAPARLHLSPRGLAGYAVAPSTLSTSTSMSRTKMCCGQAVSQRPHLTQSAGPGWRRTIWR